MNEEAQIKSVALFFFFSILDEKLARDATITTARRVQSRIKKYNLKPEQVPSSVVHCTNEYISNFKKSGVRGQASISYEAGWLLPEGVDIGLWKQFSKDVEDEEFMSVIWSRILKFSDAEVSHGLGVTEGTVRHRVSRGLRVLGELQENN